LLLEGSLDIRLNGVHSGLHSFQAGIYVGILLVLASFYFLVILIKADPYPGNRLFLTGLCPRFLPLQQPLQYLLQISFHRLIHNVANIIL
jgi:hypothetical protein